MYLERVYARPDGWVPQYQEVVRENGTVEQHLLNPPPLAHVRIVHTGHSAEQRFPPGYAEKGMAEGWLEIEGDELRILAVNDTLRYRILSVDERGHHCLLDAEQHEKYRVKRGA